MNQDSTEVFVATRSIKFSCVLACLLFCSVCIEVEADDMINGGVIGTVFRKSNSPGEQWVPAPGALVVILPAEGDSLPDPGEVTVTVYESGMTPRYQAALPGARLRLVCRSSKVQEIAALDETGNRLFSIALSVPGLEVMKKLNRIGFVSFHRLHDSSRRTLAQILVSPNLGWAVTDDNGRFLIPGIPSSCREIWAFQDQFGSMTDSVCIEPTRATETDLYLPYPASSDRDSL